MTLRKNQAGFSAVEAFVIIFILAVIGFTGYYVYHSKQVAGKTSAANPTKYLVIKQWGVEAPYAGSLTFNYKLTTEDTVQYAKFTPTQLAAYSGCENSGGTIIRYQATDQVRDSGYTASQYLKAVPSMSKQVGKYYYVFESDQDGCSNDAQAAALQSQSMDAVKAMVQSLRAE